MRNADLLKGLTGRRADRYAQLLDWFKTAAGEADGSEKSLERAFELVQRASSMMDLESALKRYPFIASHIFIESLERLIEDNGVNEIRPALRQKMIMLRRAASLQKSGLSDQVEKLRELSGVSGLEQRAGITLRELQVAFMTANTLEDMRLVARAFPALLLPEGLRLFEEGFESLLSNANGSLMATKGC